MGLSRHLFMGACMVASTLSNMNISEISGSIAIRCCLKYYYTPREHSFRGVYCFQPVPHSVQGSKCPSLPGFTHWVNPGKPGLGFKPYFGKSGEYWVIKYFKCSDVKNCANLWILRQVSLLDNKEHMYIKSIHRDLLQYLLFIYTIIL